MMFRNWLSRASLLGLLATGAVFQACDNGNLPSDTTGTTGKTSTTGTGAQGGTGGTTTGTGGATTTGTGGAGGTGGATTSTGTGGSPDCVMDPKTHVEIINACTDAEKIDKQPKLPLLNPDGSLPPLP